MVELGKVCDGMREVGGLLSVQDAASRVPAYRLQGLSFEEYVGMRSYSRMRDFKINQGFKKKTQGF